MAEAMIQRIADHASSGKKQPYVLGLPTGSSPILTYRNLVKAHKAGGVSFENVVTFNMDEYVGLGPNSRQSYYMFMHEQLFDHVNIPAENINLLDGLAKDPEKECEAYEEKIATVGGIDFFLGGIGSDGHIAFNEPRSSLGSRTRLKSLTLETIEANSRFFDGDQSQVPRQALTVGVSTVMDAVG
jgi:glucosamine-6-phosphate deaminase